MGQKSMNEKVKGQNTVALANEVLDLDDMLDDEGWDLLNSLTEEELEQLNADFDPDNALIPVADRGGISSAKNAAPMFNQEDLIQGLNKMVEDSKTVIKNDKIRAKEEKKRQEREAKLKKQYSRDKPELKREPTVELTAEEEALLEEATEEELIEAAALLKMNGILTNDQINSVWAGEKPKGSISNNTSVKGTEVKKEKRIQPKDEETELDVVELMKHLKEDSDSLFYLCINNQPKLERKIKESVIKAVRDSKKIRHLSLAMIGLLDIEAKQLAEAIRYNDKLETINLESNVITQHGLDPLMKEIARHPNIREVKIANQKQPFGGNGEECMATAIDKNENILKFGYSFKQAGPRNKADRAIIRHNEVLRQKRRNGEEVYDLKAVCKIRDPWPQPWIKVKNRRGLSGLIETKAEAMGSKIDLESDAGGESRGSDLGNAIAKPLNINDLLAQRKAKLKGTKVEELEEERERRKKELFKEMHDQDKAAKAAEEGGSEAASDAASKSKSDVEDGGVLSRLQGKYLGTEDNETAPPAQKEQKQETKEEPKKSGVKVASLNDDNNNLRRRRKKSEDEDEGGLDFGEFEQKEEAKEEVKDDKEDKKKMGTGVKVASLQNEDSKITRRRKKQDDDDEGGLDFGAFEEKKEEPKVEEKTKPAGVKIASLDKEDTTVSRRRRKKFEEEDEGGIDFGNFEEKKEEPEPAVETKKAEEKVAEKKDLKSSVKVASLQAEDNKVTRRRKKQEDEDEGGLDFGAFEEKKEEPKPKPEAPKAEVKKEEPPKKVEPKKDLKPAVKVATLQQEDSKVTRRRRKKFGNDEEEGGLDFGAFEKKEEPKPDPVPEPEPEPPKVEEKKPVEKKPEPVKKDLRSQLGKGIKVASLNNEESSVPVRRRKPKMFEEDEPEPEVKEEPKLEEDEPEEEPAEEAASKDEEEDSSRVRRRSKKSNEEEEKYDPFKGVSKNIAKLPSPPEVTRRRRKKFDEDEDEKVDIFEAAAKAQKEEEERLRKEKEEKEAAEKKAKLEEQRAKLADVEGRKKKLSLEGGRKIVAKLEEEEQKPRRRRKRYEWEDEDDTPPAKPAEEEKKVEEPEPEEEEEEEEEPKKEEEKERKVSGGKKIAALPEPESRFPLRRKKEDKEAEKVDVFAEIEKTEINAVRNAAKSLKELPPPDTGVSRRRRRRNDDDEEKYDPFANVPQKTEEKKKEEPKAEPAKSPEPEKPAEDDAAARRARRQREREEKARQQEEEEEKERKARRERRAREREEAAAKAKEEEAPKEEKKETGRWFTDEETKSGNRRTEPSEPAVDIFGDRNDDDGEPKKLSLRGRLARRGR